MPKPVIDITFIEKLKLRFSHHFYSNNTSLEDIKSYFIAKYGESRKKKKQESNVWDILKEHDFSGLNTGKCLITLI